MGTIYGTHKVREAQTLSTSQRTLHPLENQPTETLLFKEHLKWLTAETLLAVQRSYLGKNIAVTMNISSGVCDTC